MPKLKLIDSASSMLPIIYLIDESVGRGGANRRKDVLLVQFFIRMLQDQPQKLDGEQYNFIPGGGRQLRIDGICGEQTIRHIAYFKKEHDKTNAAGQRMHHDARVDAMKTGNPYGARTGSVLSILRLNQDVIASIGVERFRRLHAERLFPAELRDEFYI